MNRQDLLSATTKCRPLVHYFMEGDLSAIGLVALRDCAWSSGSPPLCVILLLAIGTPGYQGRSKGRYITEVAR